MTAPVLKPAKTKEVGWALDFSLLSPGMGSVCEKHTGPWVSPGDGLTLFFSYDQFPRCFLSFLALPTALDGEFLPIFVF